jgi:hypothetical protein
MPLQSTLLRGDPALEKCLVDDAAHLTVGVSGEHVSKVQRAVLVLGDAGIANGELAAARYGDSTAAAVLRFKQQREIINRSYESAADNIVGKMTIAELDRELLLLPNTDPRINPDENDRIRRTLSRQNLGVLNMILATMQSVADVQKAFILAESDPQEAAGLLFVNRFAVDGLERFFSITQSNFRIQLPNLIDNLQKYRTAFDKLSADQRPADYGFLIRHALFRDSSGAFFLESGKIYAKTPMGWSDRAAHAMFFTPRYREFDPKMPPLFRGLFREALQGIQIHEMGHFYFDFDDGDPRGRPPEVCLRLAVGYDFLARQINFKHFVLRQ